MLKKEEIHFFNDIAYYHVPFTHCPTGEQYRLDHKCHCKPKDNFDWNGYSCTSYHLSSQNHANSRRHFSLLRDKQHEETRRV
jgi:alpha 1,2-mannosyltransferase